MIRRSPSLLRPGRSLIKPAAALLAAALVGGGALYLSRDKPTPAETARPYLELWQSGRFERMRALVANPPEDFVAIHRSVAGGLLADGPALRLGRVTESKEKATARFAASFKLKGLGDWTYRGRMTLRPGPERWLVEWSPATIHPDLAPGRRLARSRTWPERAPILARDGTPIAATREAVVVGLQPGRVQDPAQLAKALEGSLGSDSARVAQLIEKGSARPAQFVPVEEISDERYEQVRAAIYDIPGLVFQRKDLRLPPSEEFARPLIGRVGEITEEGLQKLGEPYIAGDRVGQFGIEAAMERRLAGRPSGEVRVVRENATTLKVLERFPGEPPREVRTTLDMQVQRAADSALEGIDKRSALVAIDTASAEIRAVANRPLTGFNRAVSGRYPPGSTFKVVTSLALLSSGVGVDQKVACPPSTSAGGRTFRNFEGEGLGEIDFRTAFTESCNTAFANLVADLDDARLTAAAEAFGFGSEYALPVDTAAGSFPPPSDTTEKVAAAIGQARVEASPLHMASIAAAVASGAWRPPRLLIEEGAPGRAAETRQLDPSATAALRDLMQSVVEEGTGKRAAVPGRQVAGKTGTAEYGTSRPPRTHAWFLGFSGPLAFAVLVEDGGVGGEVAAPIAGRFISMSPGT